jgi:hypothetical protein
MAWITCPYCGRKVDASLNECPYCTASIEHPVTAGPAKRLETSGFIPALKDVSPGDPPDEFSEDFSEAGNSEPLPEKKKDPGQVIELHINDPSVTCHVTHGEDGRTVVNIDSRDEAEDSGSSDSEGCAMWCVLIVGGILAYLFFF